MRQYSSADRFIDQFDTALRTLAGKPVTTHRAYPAEGIDETSLDAKQKKHIAGLMRVNHAGEVAAQALYQGQSITARDGHTRDQLEEAAIEENDHLAWTETRLKELNDRPSLLDPFWYAGSVAIGAVAGSLGDRWNLGFLAETEQQVVSHLESHLEKLPVEDKRSRAIIEQMRKDELKHAKTAVNEGGAPLPEPVKKLMQLSSKLMTRTAYWF